LTGLEGMARILLIIGIALIILGAFLFMMSKLGLTGFRLPGDIYVRRGNFSLYFPITTMIVVSLILTLIFSLLGRR